MTPVVWLHGAGLSGKTWGEPGEGICPDLPGHGGQPRAARTDIGAFADAVLAALPPRFALVGHSLGGMVAMEIAARVPDRVPALVLAETAFSFQERWIDRKGTALAVWVARRLGPYTVAQLTAMGQKGASRMAAFRGISAMTPEGLVDAMRAVQAWDGTALLGRLTMPTLVLAGTRNPRSHPQARILARRLPDARLTMIEAGHFLHTDAPVRFHGLVRGFVAAHP